MKKLFYYVVLAFTVFFYNCSVQPFPDQKRFGFDKDGMIIINGERKFMIGTYSLPKTDHPFKELAKNGYNYTMVKPEKALLDSAEANNVFTWIVTGVSEDSISGTGKNKIVDLVNKFKDHPSLLCWEMADEPAFVWKSAQARVKPEAMRETYQAIKAIDPDHFVITNHGPVNLVSTLEKYNNSCDIISSDIYPVIPRGIDIIYGLYPDGLQGDLLNTYLSQVGQYTEKLKKVANNAKPVLMVLQGFAWEMLKKENDRNLAMIRYPTYEESRFMAYDAIVHGANGITYWGLHYTPQPSPFMDTLNLVTKELAEMQEVLSAPNLDFPTDIRYHELGYSVDRGVKMLVKKVNNSIYLITVNADKNPVKVSISGLGEFQNTAVLKEKRTLQVINGEFTDSYKPFGVHIYKLE